MRYHATVLTSRRGVQPILPTPKTPHATSDNVRYVMLIIKTAGFFGGKFLLRKSDELAAMTPTWPDAAANFGRSSLPRRTFAARRTRRADVRSTAAFRPSINAQRVAVAAGCKVLSGRKDLL